MVCSSARIDLPVAFKVYDTGALLEAVRAHIVDQCTEALPRLVRVV